MQARMRRVPAEFARQNFVAVPERVASVPNAWEHAALT
jgi:hypothetical protein